MRHAFLAATAILGTATALAGFGAFSSFLGAGAGTSVPFQRVPLPPVALGALAKACAFAPPLEQLLEGNTVITTEAAMRDTWGRLFATPYDASLFDFSTSFVVLMGAGQQTTASFGIGAVEQVEAGYANPGGPGGSNVPETFLSVTATLFIPGVHPQDPPPAAYALSAVRVDQALRDDVVFHRSLIFGV